jgi:uncharacterized tellurite resistance protein B-like protein
MSILDRIRRFGERPAAELATDRFGEPVDLHLRDAAVALLLEAAYGDTSFVEEERKVIRKGIEREFGVSQIEAAAFMDSAEGVRPPVQTLRSLTTVVRERYGEGQKLRLMALLWKVVGADREIAGFEQAFADWVAKALALTPADWKRARSLADVS